MEVDQRESGKRKLVDPDSPNQEIANAKKARVEPDVEKKVRVLRFIIGAFLNLRGLLTAGTPMTIQLGNQLANVIFTVFNIQRQKARSVVGNTERKAKDNKSFTFKTKGRVFSIPYEAATRAIVEAAAGEQLEFKNFAPTDHTNWYGTAGPYLDFFVANKSRLDELRLGHAEMPIGDNKGFPVVKYGLNGSHHVLLEGCTYAPEKRASMAQSVGPMTALLCHIRNREPYRTKWTLAAKRAMAHIPNIDEILELTKDRPAAEIRGMISALADILLITTSRQANRMTFPLSCFVDIYTLPTDENDKILSAENRPTQFVGGRTLLEGFNVSGVGGFYIYQLMSNRKYEFEGHFTENLAVQALFHSIFGTYKEDLSILEQITTLGTWNRREEFGTSFRKMTDGRSVTIEPVRFRYYSKLASANMTGLLASNYNQISSIPVFSGMRVQNFIDEFFEQLARKHGEMTAAKTIPQLTASLIQILGELRTKILNEGKKMHIGTVEWRSTENMSLKEGGAVVANIGIVGAGKFFLGSARK